MNEACWWSGRGGGCTRLANPDPNPNTQTCNQLRNAVRPCLQRRRHAPAPSSACCWRAFCLRSSRSTVSRRTRSSCCVCSHIGRTADTRSCGLSKTTSCCRPPSSLCRHHQGQQWQQQKQQRDAVVVLKQAMVGCCPSEGPPAANCCCCSMLLLLLLLAAACKIGSSVAPCRVCRPTARCIEAHMHAHNCRCIGGAAIGPNMDTITNPRRQLRTHCCSVPPVAEPRAAPALCAPAGEEWAFCQSPFQAWPCPSSFSGWPWLLLLPSAAAALVRLLPSSGSCLTPSCLQGAQAAVESTDRDQNQDALMAAAVLPARALQADWGRGGSSKACHESPPTVRALRGSCA